MTSLLTIPACGLVQAAPRSTLMSPKEFEEIFHKIAKRHGLSGKYFVHYRGSASNTRYRWNDLKITTEVSKKSLEKFNDDFCSTVLNNNKTISCGYSLDNSRVYYKLAERLT